ncbi:glycogen synthase [Ferrimonas senticii]|uniref:glycogen synthase n=1 Tax=Ferrimonas senticii TaxID=394566 RepID=UPI000420DC48|nr:glycogen/starch synthase [Ferrimonas senticii]
MIAAENGAIAGAKVGGMADVIRDLPPQLLQLDVVADVMMPAIGNMAQQAGAQWHSQLLVPFAGRIEPCELWLLNEAQQPQCTYLISHSSFDRIYHSDDDRPFATDASKFALFSAACCHLLAQQVLPAPDVIHLHDWHSCFVAMLLRLAPQYRQLSQCRLVLTIHNLALQGIRPLQHDSSSLACWYPNLYQQLTAEQLDSISDRHHRHCVNPLRAGINLVDRIHVVSPTYAEEIVRPSQPQLGFFGGEGLEADLQRRQGQLVGILNGCDYQQPSPPGDYQQLLNSAENAIAAWMGRQPQLRSVDQLALLRLAQWRRSKPHMLLTSVGRLTDQKVLLLRHRQADGRSTLAHLLEQLQRQPHDVRLLVLGSGDRHIADEFRQLAGEFANFLFIDGYNEPLSLQVFAQGDLFLMPSSFEPCGLSQLLAMRAGQVCLVHSVGGLKDTVVPQQHGYGFNGDDLDQQSQQLLATVELALRQFGSDTFSELQRQARQLRFDWQRQLPIYIDKLYG